MHAEAIRLLAEREPVTDACTSGWTVSELAKRWRVSPDKIRSWIRRGELVAINTASVLLGKPRWIVTADGVAIFEKSRRSSITPKTSRSRRLSNASEIDFFPGD